MKKIICILILAIILGLSGSSVAVPPFDPSYYISQIIHGRVVRPLYLLTVTGSGSGNGIITSDIYGINCTSTAGTESGTCSTQVPMGTTVVLTATAPSGSMFMGWSGSGCSGMGTCTILMDGNKTVDANFGIMPFAGDLVAWYRVNEGAGLTLNNIANPTVAPAEKWPNLTIGGDAAYFWAHLAGFGSSGAGGNIAYADWSDAASARTVTGNDSFCLFFRREGMNQQYPCTLAVYAAVGAFAATHTYQQWDMNLMLANVEIGAGGASRTNALGAINNKWGMVFALNGGPANLRVRYVRDDGTLATEFNVGGTNGAAIRKIHTFYGYDSAGGFNAYIYGQVADIMYWRNQTLTLADYAAIYDAYRSRFGMAARSGW